MFQGIPGTARILRAPAISRVPLCGTVPGDRPPQRLCGPIGFGSGVAALWYAKRMKMAVGTYRHGTVGAALCGRPSCGALTGGAPAGSGREVKDLSKTKTEG